MNCFQKFLVQPSFPGSCQPPSVSTPQWQGRVLSPVSLHQFLRLSGKDGSSPLSASLSFNASLVRTGPPTCLPPSVFTPHRWGRVLPPVCFIQFLRLSGEDGGPYSILRFQVSKVQWLMNSTVHQINKLPFTISIRVLMTEVMKVQRLRRKEWKIKLSYWT